MSVGSDQKLTSIFEDAYRGFHSGFYRDRDPVSFVHLYPEAEAQEVVGLITALLSYGNVKAILRSVGQAMNRLGPSPRTTIVSGNFEGAFDSFRHRFTTGDDLEILCHWIRHALEEAGSLEAFFLAGGESSVEMKDRLSSFVRRLSAGPLPPRARKALQKRQRNMKYLLSDPHAGSACKRLNMYLRWMVRPADGVDLGLWKRVDPAHLMLPVDTHILKIIRHLRWTKTRSANWKVVEEATRRLRELNAGDPIRYDFSLCHISMEGKSSALYAQMERRPLHEKGPKRKLRGPVRL